jgi:hypothetical protein
MPTVYKVLGQSNPSATTLTDVYTVPVGNNTVISTFNVCNQGATPASFRIAVRPAGETVSAKHYLAYDTNVNNQDAISLTMGITLANTDVISVYSNTSTMSFSVFGTEIY